MFNKNKDKDKAKIKIDDLYIAVLGVTIHGDKLGEIGFKPLTFIFIRKGPADIHGYRQYIGVLDNVKHDVYNSYLHAGDLCISPKSIKPATNFFSTYVKYITKEIIREFVAVLNKDDEDRNDTKVRMKLYKLNKEYNKSQEEDEIIEEDEKIKR